MRKHSRQRDCIKQFLASRTDHPTAETVYENIRKEIPNISLATIYRNLALLSDMGEIRKISIGQGPDRFDGNTKPHSHFMCRQCGQIIDLEPSSVQSVSMLMTGEPFTGKIESHSTNFYGICPDCLAAAQQKEEKVLQTNQ